MFHSCSFSKLNVNDLPPCLSVLARGELTIIARSIRDSTATLEYTVWSSKKLYTTNLSQHLSLPTKPR